MGEAKRKAIVDELTKRLVDDGKLIDGGWQALRMLAIPPDASKAQVDDMRVAYFAGAQHLYACMMSMLEEGQEPTETDIKRMDAIHNELEEFYSEMKLRLNPVQGEG